MFYAHFQDFVDCYVGPFNTVAECDAYAVKAKEESDAKYFGAIPEAELPTNAFKITPEGEHA